MTDLYAPYEAPTIQSRGWVVGPNILLIDPGGATGAGLPADITVSPTFAVDVGSTAVFPLTFPYLFGAPLGGGAGLDAELVYTPTANFSALPAAGDCDSLSTGFTVDVPVTMNFADGSGGTAIVPTLSVVVPLAIQGSATIANGATSVTLPAHAVGDIIVLFVYNTASTTPTKPSASGTVPAWVDIDANAGTGSSATREVYFVASATNHTSGTWTNTNGLCAVVLRGQNASPIGGHAEAVSSGGAGTIDAPAVTMANTSGSSVLLHFHMSGGNVGMSTAPSGYTRLVDTGGFAPNGMALNKKTVSTSDGLVGQVLSAGTTSSPRGATVEIKN